MEVSDDIGWQIHQMKDAKEHLEYDAREQGWMVKKILERSIQYLDLAIDKARTARDAVRENERRGGK